MIRCMYVLACVVLVNKGFVVVFAGAIYTYEYVAFCAIVAFTVMMIFREIQHSDYDCINLICSERSLS